MENLCRYIPPKQNADELQLISIVFESEHKFRDKPFVLPFYRLCLVSSGSCELTVRREKSKLEKGTLFILLPSVPYSMEIGEDFSYYFIDFLGLRANKMIDKLGIRENNSVFSDFSSVEVLITNALHYSGDERALAAEGVLLYVFAMLGNRSHGEWKVPRTKGEQVFLSIKDYIDRYYNDQEISLKTMANKYSYSPKYLSALFKTNMKIGFKEYVNAVRTQQACELMEKGLTYVSEIATLCGYSDPLYFSKCFKAHLGVSPKEYIFKLKKTHFR